MDKKNCFYERSNYRFSDTRVQFYSDVIDEMKTKILYCRKFVFYVSNSNNSSSALVDYFDDLFKTFILKFVDFCMENLDKNNMEHSLYSNFIDININEIINKLKDYCENNNLKYTLDLDNLTEDYLFV